jgi:outer membrane protein assembly factor BamA
MKNIVTSLLFFLVFSISYAQTDEHGKKVKTGWNFGVLPVVGYNSDLGFQYGGLINLYNYGDGSIFPKYKHSIFLEISRYTKGSGIFRLFYDTEYLIPNVRFSADALYLPEQAMDFYGFNGYEAVYNSNFTDDSSPDYISRIFYRHSRNFLRIKLDFRGKTFLKNLDWVLGYRLMNVEVGSVPIDKLNKGKNPAKQLPDVPGLYDKYVAWGIISADESRGGFSNNLKAGLVYDTRDNEPNPMEGIWSEIVLLNSFGKDFTFGKLSATHRQYFTIVPRHLSFVYRLGYQGIIYGDAPFYMLSYMSFSYMPVANFDGLGGSKTVRGMIRDRVVADGVAFANFEFRYKFLYFNFINQHWYLALNPFVDAGITARKTKLDLSGVPDDDFAKYFAPGSEKLHLTYGCGFHIAMNENFVIAAEVGMPIKKTDGKMGVYIGLNWLF